MVFSSLIFLYIFLPAVLLCYYLIPAGRSGHTGGGSSNHNININKQARNAVLLIFSIIFYAWGEPVYVLGILASVIINFLFGSLLEKKKSKLLLALNIFLNLSYLAVFKYTDFCIGTINNLFGSSIALTKLVLPIGISFYTFQALSYTIDVYRGKVSSVSAGCPEKNTSKNRRKTSGEEFPDSQTEEKKSHAVSRLSRNLNGLLNFGTYLTMFPQLIAGPIVRYDTIRQELGTRKETLEDFTEGFIRFSSGLGKKVLLANSFGSIWDDIRLGAESDMTTAAAWLGMLCFSLQIYFDFSGYSDMAIGLGRMFGFHFNENFDYPYISKTITEFWRRWHISLSTWFKEYVYIPLGGNRDGIKKQIRNILIVWGLTGLWHGAAWSFVLWGLYYAILLITEKIILLKLLKKIPAIISRSYTLLFVIAGWGIFSIPDIKDGLVMPFIRAVFFSGENGIYNHQIMHLLDGNIVLIIVGCIVSTGVITKLVKSRIRCHEAVYRIGSVVYSALIFFASTACMVADTYNPFLYFRF